MCDAPESKRRYAATLIWIGATLFVQIVFEAWPGVDLAVAGLFYDAQRGFWLASLPWLEILRQMLWAFGVGVTALCLGGAALGLMGWRLFDGCPGWWQRASLLLILGPGLLVNGVFKAHWGRARPRDVTLFGGHAPFSPPSEVVDYCSGNCSFMSGEGALALSVTLLVLVVAMRRLSGRARVAAVALALGYSVGMAGLRIAFGAHFLSDTLYALLLCTGLWLALGQVPLWSASRPPLPGAAPFRLNR